jgi:hypothetical protein
MDRVSLHRLFNQFGYLERKAPPAARLRRLFGSGALLFGLCERLDVPPKTSVLPFSNSATIRQ